MGFPTEGSKDQTDAGTSSLRSRSRRFGAWMMVAGVIVGVILAVALGRVAQSGRANVLSNLAALFTGRTTVDTSSPSVVDKVRKLARLESVDFSIDKIVEGKRESLLLPNFLAGDKLLLIAHGEVIAGVDLSAMQASDVVVNGDSVRLHLPAAQVLSTRLDNEHSRVYSRDTGLLVTADPNLETEAREAAEQQIRQAAIADGILDKARVNARASVTSLLYALGFRTVDVS